MFVISQITYNGITLPYGATTSFKQVAVRDDLGDTDWILTRFDITVNAVINLDYLPLLAPDLVNASTGDTASFLMKTVRPRLLQHRKRLSFTFAGEELIPEIQEGNLGTVDADNGPKPQTCDILELTNTTFLISYHIIASYWENFADASATFTPPPVSIDNPTGNPVLFNRWTDSIDISDLSMSRRTREGKFRIRSDNAAGLIADQFRFAMAQLGVPAGFLRESSRYVVSPDGLSLQYQIVDKEVFKLPPSPAYKAAGEYTESSGKASATRFVEAWVRLEAAKTVNQSVLVQKCISVVVKKLHINFSDRGDQPSAIPISASLRLGMYDNWVHCQIKAQVTKTTKRYDNIAWMNKSVCFTPFSDAGGTFQGATTPAYPVYGTAGRLLQAAAYWDPSLRNLKMDPKTGNIAPPQKEVGQAGLEGE